MHRLLPTIEVGGLDVMRAENAAPVKVSFLPAADMSNQHSSMLCSRFLYPFFVALMVSSVTFPLGMGQFIAADQTTHDQV